MKLKNIFWFLVFLLFVITLTILNFFYIDYLVN